MNFYVDVLKQNQLMYDWKTLYVGLKLGLVNFSEITNHAIEFLTNHSKTKPAGIIFPRCPHCAYLIDGF
ncbi:DUF2247 family protein [Bacillus sp. REN3]|uniref:DUF2247 family protein n=1 Tax=Bacillus sp. REN3 TaxID=2802440 RepID=UPI001AEE4200|nr:DUF2247 family protein [Bacillus sp. REN3]